MPGMNTNVIIQAKTLAIERGFRKTVIKAAIVLINKSANNTVEIMLISIFIIVSSYIL
jgi:hypothetical protein